ncbi:MAG: DNA translocase FtsK [Opitutales bacterium]|nr:DNA translocase FtsK [Opitutales bacterium]
MPAPARKRSASLAKPASESHPVLAIILGLIGTFILVAMVFHSKSDQTLFPQWIETKFQLQASSDVATEHNPCGLFGATVAVILFSLFGYTAFLIPTFLFAAAWFSLNHRAHTLWPTKTSLMLACIILGAPVITMSLGGPSSGAFDSSGSGGVTGGFLYTQLCQPVLGDYGAWILIFPYGFCLLGVLADDPKATLSAWLSELRDMFGAWTAERKEAAKREAIERKQRAERVAELRRKQMEIKNVEIAAPVVVALEPKKVEKTEEVPAVVVVTRDDVKITPGLTNPTVETPVLAPRIPTPVLTTFGTQKFAVTRTDKIEKANASAQLKKKGDYTFPTISLLNEPVVDKEIPVEDFKKRASDLIETLMQFKVSVVPVDPEAGIDVGIQQGPSITRYEIKPAPGVRVEKISNLSNNIAMNLSAESVRILAPVPGRGTVGIEIPNLHRKDVLLREIIQSKAWTESTMEIPVVLGVDSVTNKPVIQDLAKMPHCLIAGATGQGKSVCINSFIISILYRCTPEDLRFIMVDPKVVELQVYSKLPHLLIPVETDPRRVPAALKWLIAEMQRRYKIFAKCGVKNITGFNAKIKKEAGVPKQEELPLSADEQAAAREAAESVVDDGISIPTTKLPYIVCIIDEMADLMMAAAKEVETSIARLAQLARAAGIHLVLATQRPSTDVITGLIKANLPTRIGFKVASYIDSRTILDRSGAETLVGRGDMLFVPPGSASLSRVQGAYVGEQEVSAIIDYINEKNGSPEFAQEVVDAIEKGSSEDFEGGEGDGEEGDDPMVAQAWSIIKENQRASVSMLQRRLKLGYNRAARIMDILHDRGFVGPENGSSPREIIGK